MLRTPFRVHLSEPEQVPEPDTASAALPPLMTGQGLVIGLLENDPHVRDAYQQALSKHGFDVVVFSEDEAQLQVQLQNLHHMDCLLTDYHLSHSTADVFIARIRDEFNDNIPAIIVSGDTAPATLHKLQTLNLTVLHKPVDMELIVREIRRITEPVSA